MSYSTAAIVMAISFFGRATAAFLGSGRDRAVPWKQFAKQAMKGMLGGLLAGGGIGFAVQMYLGYRSGQILWYIFELESI
ncbi:MAG: hypothetical protein HONBIEJF_02237 [Fimbriimonadaceae bacterium]|nr:hypothetical protein [Fimbriimonadaceae bacterium]